ncbi:hypothetical protein BC938DRAFT_473163 [Jimgerdemannia flammicorona]|uniref:Uncharacterized protein n=1 Tax=Jimgerdemannia flammicorona TaxID=994334 RepID=A0A433QZS7_9FUNG|nr:hypothetical protein BC938DRAFT_473163 [Jimgerdemannia flammicorona]
MTMVAIFCTHSINILAGINGVEAGQSLIIAISVAANDLLFINGTDPASVEAHLLSLYFMLPFIGVTVSCARLRRRHLLLLRGHDFCRGWDSRPFQQDTPPLLLASDLQLPLLCAASLPSSRVPSPPDAAAERRHRPAGILARAAEKEARRHVRKADPVGLRDRGDCDGRVVETNNFTLINLLLVKLGPMSEGRVTAAVMVVQVMCSLLAFFVRAYIRSRNKNGESTSLLLHITFRDHISQQPNSRFRNLTSLSLMNRAADIKADDETLRRDQIPFWEGVAYSGPELNESLGIAHADIGVRAPL